MISKKNMIAIIPEKYIWNVKADLYINKTAIRFEISCILEEF